MVNLARNILEKIGLKFGKLRYGIRCFLSTQIKKTSNEKFYDIMKRYVIEMVSR